MEPINRYHGKTRVDYKRKDTLIKSLTPDSPLAQRLIECGTLSEGTHGWQRICRLPACPRCRTNYAKREAAKVVKGWAGTSNDALGMITIVGGIAATVDEIGDVFLKARRDLRNLVDRQKLVRRRWRGFGLIGWLEVDSLTGEDFPMLGSQRSKLLHEIGIPAGCTDQTIWVPTIHAAVRFARIDYQEVQAELSHQWPIQRQAVLTRAYDHLTPVMNIENIISYSLKHKCITKLDGKLARWSGKQMAEYYSWLYHWTPSFRRTRVIIGGNKKAKKPKKLFINEYESYDCETGEIYTEPMPVII